MSLSSTQNNLEPKQIVKTAWDNVNDFVSPDGINTVRAQQHSLQSMIEDKYISYTKLTEVLIRLQLRKLFMLKIPPSGDIDPEIREEFSDLRRISEKPTNEAWMYLSSEHFYKGQTHMLSIKLHVQHDYAGVLVPQDTYGVEYKAYQIPLKSVGALGEHILQQEFEVVNPAASGAGASQG